MEEALKNIKDSVTTTGVTAEVYSFKGVFDGAVWSITKNLTTTKIDYKSKVMGLVEVGGKKIAYFRRHLNYNAWEAHDKFCKESGGKLAEDITKADLDILSGVLRFTDESTDYAVGASSTSTTSNAKSTFKWLNGNAIEENVWSDRPDIEPENPQQSKAELWFKGYVKGTSGLRAMPDNRGTKGSLCQFQ